MHREILVELPYPPRGLSPNARLTVFAKAALFKKTRLLALGRCKRALADAGIDEVTLAGARPDNNWRQGTVNVGLRPTPPINRYRDEDNLIATCKAYFDGLSAALGVDDCTFHLLEQQWSPARAPGHLTIFVSWEDCIV